MGLCLSGLLGSPHRAVVIDEIREATSTATPTTSSPLTWPREPEPRPSRSIGVSFRSTQFRNTIAGWIDTHGRLLEIVVLLLDDGTELAIHAMKARTQYLDLLP